MMFVENIALFAMFHNSYCVKVGPHLQTWIDLYPSIDK